MIELKAASYAGLARIVEVSRSAKQWLTRDADRRHRINFWSRRMLGAAQIRVVKRRPCKRRS
jgi:hypothetical protein